jgi:hypothetical protein
MRTTRIGGEGVTMVSATIYHADTAAPANVVKADVLFRFLTPQLSTAVGQ